MTAPTRTPRGKGRPWIALFTSLLNDTDLILAGQDARALYPYLLLHSAEQGLDGCVPADPRKVQLFAHFDGGVTAVKAALDALVDIGKLVRVDEATLAIRTWDRYQSDLGGSSTRAASMSAVKFKQAHAAGKHAGEPRGGCPECEGADTVTETTAPVEAPAAAPAAPAVAEGPTSAAIKAKVWDYCDRALAQAEQSDADALEAYQVAHEAAQAATAKYAAVKGIGEATLLNVVVSHAAKTFLARESKPVTAGTERFLHGLRRDHGFELVARMADPSVTQATDPVAYLRGIYRNGGAK